VLIFKQVLEAFAVGDAMGMPTEFMTLKMIRNRFGLIDTLIDPSVSLIHKNLKKGQITDDTEQVLYLLETFYEKKGVTVEGTVEGICRWIEETHADEKGYIGPSSLKALKKIQDGENPEKAGTGGTTCGAAMRVLAPALSVEMGNKEKLKEAIHACSIPTHNTNIALEAAMSLGFGFHTAVMGASFDEILESILEGAKIGREISGNEFVGASTGERIRYALDKISNLHSPEEVMSFIYDVIGTNMESNEVVPAAVSIFAYARDDTWLSIRIGASIGGDTDTIAAISGALSCLYSRGHNIPNEVVEEVLRINNLNLERYAKMVQEMLGGKK
jgi:ADP-ribosylglycohydrolase